MAEKLAPLASAPTGMVRKLANEPISVARPVLEAAPEGAERLLLVEDEEAVRRTMGRTLSDLGYQVVEVATGAEALEVLASEVEIDVILTDIVMPGGVLGPDLAKQVRDRDPDMPIVFMSGYADQADARHQLRKRSGVFLQKPFTLQELVAVLSSSVGAARPT